MFGETSDNGARIPGCQRRSSREARASSARTSAKRYSVVATAVICVDNLETGSLANIEHLRDDAFEFVPHDLTQHVSIAEPIDFVFHLASPASPIDYLRLPLQTLKVGSHGTHNALGLAKAKRARFLLASTSEVYGDPQVHPQPETYWGHVNPIGPRGVYDEAKRYAEALTMAYHRQQGVDTAIVRIFNTYGPRMRPHDGRAIPTFIRQALDEKPLTVFGDGLADAELLLRRRPRARPDPARRVGRASAGQRRQSDRDDAAQLAEAVIARLRLRPARSSSRRCRSTIRRSASPTSPARSSCSAGSRRSISTRDCAARWPRSAGERSLRRVDRDRCGGDCRRGVGCSPADASASRYLKTGIFDDAQVLYGTPGADVPAAQDDADPSSSGSTSGGRGPASAWRHGAPSALPNPADPAYDWSTYDRTVTFAANNGMQVVFSIIGTPPMGERRTRLERRSHEGCRPERVCDCRVDPVLRQVQGPRRQDPAAREQLARLERAEQSCLHAAPVRPRRDRPG